MVTKAKESEHIKKMRKKIKEHIQEENKQITPQALQKMRETIHHWLERHATERKAIKNLKEKQVSFNENQNPASISSHYVQHLQKLLKQTLIPGQKKGALAGRITKR